MMDAMSFKVYEQWNDIKTLEAVSGGGFGGNKKMGKLVYDGLSGNLSKLDMQRDGKTCYLQNSEVTVTDFRTNNIARFECVKPDPDHDNVYWDGSADQYNGGYSPNNDALYAGKIIREMYQSWYGVPVLTNNNEPMVLSMVTHAVMRDELNMPVYDNAEWDPETQKMYFGDGKQMFYPLTSLGVGAHEISHGFTEQHSDLEYNGQSGGMNESFSDMAAQAAEFYSGHNNTWKIGAEITIKRDLALRYMDVPSKDCADVKPGRDCSIDNVKKYYPKLNVHFSSGIYNRVFFLMSTAPDWDVKKAFDVMVQANSHYWTATSTFAQGACGVLSAAKDFKYDLSAVKKAFADVGINTGKCS
jgi:pseudolysin